MATRPDRPVLLIDVPPESAPLALHRAHAATAVGTRVELRLTDPGWTDQRARDVVEGAGFGSIRRMRRNAGGEHQGGDARSGEPSIGFHATRARTLADTVGPGLRVLVCGLNPSIYAADAGIGFARPGNRFWPAALAAGLVTADRDPLHALEVDRVGMTDLVKRATVSADELTNDEYRAGLARVERLVAWLGPGVVCFVGLAGWRAARAKRAVAGLQEQHLGGRPVYLMPSTSGLNAHATPPVLRGHLEAALELASADS